MERCAMANSPIREPDLGAPGELLERLLKGHLAAPSYGQSPRKYMTTKALAGAMKDLQASADALPGQAAERGARKRQRKSRKSSANPLAQIGTR